MMDRIKDATLSDLEITIDFLDHTAIATVFLGELMDRRNDLLEALIDKGGDENRYKIQMIDEVVGLRDEIFMELKSRRSEAD